MRCAIYTPLSTDEQATSEYSSLRRQEEVCRNEWTAEPSSARKSPASTTTPAPSERVSSGPASGS